MPEIVEEYCGANCETGLTYFMQSVNLSIEKVLPIDGSPLFYKWKNNRSVCEAGAVIFLRDCILLRNQVQRLLNIS